MRTAGPFAASIASTIAACSFGGTAPPTGGGCEPGECTPSLPEGLVFAGAPSPRASAIGRCPSRCRGAVAAPADDELYGWVEYSTPTEKPSAVTEESLAKRR